MGAAKFEIRKLTIGEILDESFKIFRHGFWRFILFQLVIYVPSIAIFAAMIYGGGELLIKMIETSETPGLADIFAPLSLGLFALLFIHGVVSPISSVALTSGVADTYLSKEWTASTLARRALKKAGSAIAVGGAVILALVTAFLLPVVLLAGGAFVLLGADFASIGAGGAALMVAATFFGALIGVVLGTWVTLRYSMVLTLVAIEDVGFARAFARSKELMTGAYGQGLGLLGILIAFGLLGGVLMTAFVPSPSFEGLDPDAIKSMIPSLVRSQMLSSIGSQIAGLFIGTYTAIAWTLFYFSRRCVREGFDLSYLADRLARGE